MFVVKRIVFGFLWVVFVCYVFGIVGWTLVGLGCRLYLTYSILVLSWCDAVLLCFCIFLLACECLLVRFLCGFGKWGLGCSALVFGLVW